MPRLKSANFAVTELASGITNAATSFQVVDASLFPNEGPFIVLVHDSTPGFAGVREIMEVGSINKGTNTFSDVLRGREGTSPVAHSAGARAECVWTAGTHEELADKVDLDAHLSDYASKQFGDRPYISTENKTYYLDAVNGNDNNDGKSQATAFKTWAKVLSLIPRIGHHTFVIRIIGNLPEPITLEQHIHVGSNTLMIIGDTENAANHIISGISRVRSVMGGHYQGISLRHLTFSGTVSIYSAVGVYIGSCRTVNVGDDRAIMAGWGSNVLISNHDFGTNQCRDCISCEAMSVVFSDNNIGNGTRYGLYAVNASIIGKSGTQPTGTIANEITSSGGEIR